MAKKHRNKTTKRKNILIYGIGFLFVVLCILFPLLLDIFIFGNEVPSNLDNEAWASFLGSYIGGLLSLVGIFITIRFTKYENDKDRTLMCIPIIQVMQCTEKRAEHTVFIDTNEEYIDCKRSESVVISFKNVGLGHLINGKICNMVYYPRRGGKVEQNQEVNLGIFKRDEVLKLEFRFQLNIDDGLLGNIEKDSNEIFNYCNYGGELKMQINGEHLDGQPYERNVQIRVSSQIIYDGSMYKYEPTIHLFNIE